MKYKKDDKNSYVYGEKNANILIKYGLNGVYINFILLGVYYYAIDFI